MVGEIQLFLILTTQHSGSDWFSEQLNARSDIACDLESLIELDRMRLKEPPTWGDWQQQCMEALEEARSKAASRKHAAAAGFKLMYSQVRHDPYNFTSWLVEKNISVLHLVREASLLRLNDVRHEAARVAQVGRSLYSVKNSSMIQELRTAFAPRAYTPASIRGVVHNLEKPVLMWRGLLHESHRLHHHEVHYERLLSVSTAAEEFSAALSFLGASPEDAHPIIATDENGISMRIHPPTCDQRITNWSQLKSAINGTMTYRACEFLAGQATQLQV